MISIKNHIAGNEIIVYADIALYSKDAVFKCLYWYGDKFHATVNIQDEKFYRISLLCLQDTFIGLQEMEMYLQKLERDIVDFNLRDIVTKETKNIRDLLVAKAFSNGEFDEQPPGEIADPVGFNIQ